MRRHRLGASILSLAALCALSISGGCVSWNLKSGKTMPQGRGAWTVGFSAVELEGETFSLPLVAYRYSPAERWDMGVETSWLSFTLDARYQILVDEKHGLDSAIQIGAGTLVVPFNFAGITLSKDVGEFTPYLHYKRTWIDFSEFSSSSGSVTELTDVVSLGSEIHLDKKLAIIVEVGLVTFPVIEENFVSYSFGFRFGGSD